MYTWTHGKHASTQIQVVNCVNDIFTGGIIKHIYYVSECEDLSHTLFIIDHGLVGGSLAIDIAS